MDVLTDNIIFRGGWVMVPIIIGSIIAFALSIERGMVLWKSRLDTGKFADFVSSLAKQGALKEAKDYCASTLHPIGRVFAAGLERWGESPDEIERAMEHAGNDEVSRLERNMPLLMIIVGVEPLMGFCGTIIGLIRAFMAWESAASTVTVEQLAAGIYQAMITTAAGLIVAIPFYIVYGLYQSRISAIARELNHHGEELIRARSARPSRKRQ